MGVSSARIVLPPHGTVGTAWCFDERLMMTAAHCFGDVTTAAEVTGEVRLHFEGMAPVAAKVIAVDRVLDVAIVEMTGPVPRGLELLPLGEPPPDDPSLDARWFARGFPEAADGQGLNLAGELRGWIDHDGIPSLQLQCTTRDLTYASGAAIMYQRTAVGVLRAGLEGNDVVFATRMDAIAERLPQVKARMRGVPVGLVPPDWLEVDRVTQWQRVQARVREAGMSALLVHGASPEAPELFLQRVETDAVELGVDCRRVAEWPRGPLTAEDLLAALSVALDGPDDSDPAAVAYHLSRASARVKLVILQPLVRVELMEHNLDEIARFYKVELPKVAAVVQKKGALFLQPITWTVGAERAMRFRNALVRNESAFAVEPLAELGPVGEMDFKNFLTARKADLSLLDVLRRAGSSREAFEILRNL